jgi:hypothetical protein
MRIIAIISVLSQIDGTNFRNVIFGAVGMLVYGFLIHRDSFEQGYKEAVQDLVKVKE